MRKQRNFCLAFTLLALILAFTQSVVAQHVDLGKNSWKIWLDEEAGWQNDSLFLPGEFCLEELPVNAPSCGWDEIYALGKEATLPAVVEEFYSGGDATWTYHGVSWFTTRVEVPADWKNQVIRLYVGKKNRRLEIYVNEELAGYDLVYAAPYSCDISAKLRPGETNRLAFRITNPGGSRGWGDFPLVKWGDYQLPFGRNFGGIGGEVKLLVSDPIFLEDVFVQNLLPAGENKVAAELQIQNASELSGKVRIEVQIKEGDEVLHSETRNLNQLDKGENHVTFQFRVPGAKQWDIARPHLYTCRASIKSGDYEHVFNREFAFRVFEVRANEAGQQNFYLNGKRFRHRSAIDWGLYGHHGFYPSGEMARKSVQSALDIGHNGINCHRHMADELLLLKADKLGLLILEEPGGFDPLIDMNAAVWGKPSFEGKLMEERCLRMAARDRHHPSVAGYILANEREEFDLLRKNVMLDMHALDPSKLIVNQSGGHPGGPAGQIPHLRPYDTKFRLDYFDDHTVGAEERFMEFEFHGHQGPVDRNSWKFGRIDPLAHENIIYWGEVRCYAGPDNWFAINRQSESLPEGRTGYDYKNSENLAVKTAAYFKRNRLAEQEGSGIQSPADLSVQAGRGLMYSNGRLGQILLSSNSTDGYAINGWSGGSSVLPPGHGSNLEWYSAMVDEGRNLKGPAADLATWIRPLQVAIFRMNGKYFTPGDSLKLKVALVNEGILEAGTYAVLIRIRDGAGKYTPYRYETILEVKGGDCYAQTIVNKLEILIPSSWHAGYLTIEGSLVRDSRSVAEGYEQVLLKNRSSYKDELGARRIEVHKWPEAEKALAETGYKSLISGDDPAKKVILAGEVLSERSIRTRLKDVEEGARMIIHFDSLWAGRLFDLGLLSRRVEQWGGHQKGHWIGNGWGYIDGLPGPMSHPGKGIIGTNSWEIPGDPLGFSPFESDHPQSAYGAWFARPDILLTLYGEISYGKGRILLAPSYPVDDENAFNDLIFFNMILQ